jgi:hypothetical protein
MVNTVTHAMGIACMVCKEVLQESNCSCGEDHGVAWQQNNAWARAQWPTHPCYVKVQDYNPTR